MSSSDTPRRPSPPAPSRSAQDGRRLRGRRPHRRRRRDRHPHRRGRCEVAERPDRRRRRVDGAPVRRPGRRAGDGYTACALLTSSEQTRSPARRTGGECRVVLGGDTSLGASAPRATSPASTCTPRARTTALSPRAPRAPRRSPSPSGPRPPPTGRSTRRPMRPGHRRRRGARRDRRDVTCARAYASTRPDRPRGLSDRTRLHADVRVLRRCRRRRRHRDDPPGARARRDPPRYRRRLRQRPQRGARRARDTRPPRRGRPRDEVRQRHGQPGHDQRPPGVRPRGLRGEPTAAGRRHDRPLPAAPRRSRGPDRGDRRRAVRARRRGQGPLDRPVRGARARPAPRCGRPSDHEPAERVLAARARCGGRGPRHLRGAGNRLPALLAALARPARRQPDARLQVRRGRLARGRPLPARRARAPRRERAARRGGGRDRRGARRDPGAGRARVAARPPAVDRADPGDEAAEVHRGQRRRAGRELSAGDEERLETLAASVEGARYESEARTPTWVSPPLAS